MLLEDRASVEAVLDDGDPSKLRIDIRVHPIGSGSLGSEAGEIQRPSDSWSPRTRGRSGEAGSPTSSASSCVWGSAAPQRCS